MMRGCGRGGGWRRGRRWLRMLEPALLLLLHHGPAHGYTLLERLDDLGLGEVNPSVVYRVLRGMEEQGWVVSMWDEEQSQGPPRRVYRLTAQGNQVLAMWKQELEEMRGRLDQFLADYEHHMGSGEGEYH